MKILLLDTNFSAKPIYDYMLNSGFEVYVMGGNPNDALAKSVRNYINQNYADIDNVKKIIKQLKIDYLVPGGNDFSYKICSEINSELPFFNIDTTEVTDIINNKQKFREYASKIQLHVPKIISFADISSNLPVIIKPVDSYSGHGMSIISENNMTVINNAIENAKKNSKSKQFVIEQFVMGQLYSHSAFIVNGEILIDFIVEEHCTINNFVVDTSRVIPQFNKEILNQIRNDISKLITSLGLPDGLIHTQFIGNEETFWLIEITRRCPGDLYSKLIEYSTGFPYAEYYANPFLNIKNKKYNAKLIKKQIIRHTITVSNKMIFNSVVFNKQLNILEYIPLSITGDEIKESPFSRIALMFVKPDNPKHDSEIYNYFINRSLYYIR